MMKMMVAMSRQITDGFENKSNEKQNENQTTNNHLAICPPSPILDNEKRKAHSKTKVIKHAITNVKKHNHTNE